MNITFRDYKEQDKSVVLDLIKKLGEFVKSLDPIQRIQNAEGFYDLSLKDTLEKVEKYQGKIWLAEDENTIIGFIVGVIWEQSEKNRLEIGTHKLGEVIDLYLDDAYRGQGLGPQMLSKMEEYFQEKGCDSMWISVFASNENAYNVYKKFGFVDREIGMLKQLAK